MPKRRYAAVIGKSDDCPPAVARQAYDLGRLLAQSGFVVVTGGVGDGTVKGEAYKGACEAGGTCVALCPSQPLDTSGTAEVLRRRVRAYREGCHQVRTGLTSYQRNYVTAFVADAVIALQGEVGTASEAAWALTRGLPVVLLGSRDSLKTVDSAKLQQVLQEGMLRFQTPPVDARALLQRLLACPQAETPEACFVEQGVSG